MNTISKTNLVKKNQEIIKNNDSTEFENKTYSIKLVHIDYLLNNNYNNNYIYFEKDFNFFNKLAHEQWNGLEVYTGQYLALFDRIQGFSFYNIVYVELEGLIINNYTKFNIINKNNEDSIDIDIFNYITRSMIIEKKKLIPSSKIIFKIIGYINSGTYDEEESNIEDISLFKEYIRDQ